MTKLLLLALLIYLIYHWLFPQKARLRDKPGGAAEKAAPSLVAETMVKDPVCGVYLPESQALAWNQEGVKHYFCSDDCRSKFKQTAKP